MTEHKKPHDPKHFDPAEHAHAERIAHDLADDELRDVPAPPPAQRLGPEQFAGPAVSPIAIYLGEGERIDYTPVADVKAGDVIDLGTCVGIATTPIAATMLGSLAVEGVFDITKRAGSTCALGDKIYWSVSGQTASNNATYNDAIMGFAIQAALAGDATLRVKLWPNFA